MAETGVTTPNVGGVLLNPGEHLHYFLTVRGAQPVFNLSCKHRTLKRESDFPGHPQMEYDWTLTPRQLDEQAEDYTVAMSYFAALEYSLRIEHHGRNHSLIQVAVEKDYAGEETDDFDAEILGVEKGQ
ncbi:MAG TPA: hypothetical protein VG778_09600 [Blastocatellia bacterium]|jgi:hypothetical protein|nr:hypothetical protein [Blastocatellia bacterium]